VFLMSGNESVINEAVETNSKTTLHIREASLQAFVAAILAPR